MKKRAKFFLLMILVPFIFIGYKKYAPSANSVEIVIAHFNDLAGIIDADKNGKGGLLNISGIWNDIKSHNPDAILLVSGDLITGSAISSLTKGEAIFKIADKIGIDAFVPGNHEFDYGVPQYLKFLNIAHFPFIAMNIEPVNQDENIKYVDEPYIYLNAGKTKIAVIGVISEITSHMTFPENTKGLKFTDPTNKLKKIIPELDRDAQLVVALTHIGESEDRELARKTAGIDLIVGGHTPKPIFEPVRVRKTWILNSGSNGNFLGVARIRIDPITEKVLSVKEKLIPVTRKYPPDEEAARCAADEKSKLGINLGETICKSKYYMDRNADVGPWLASILKNYTGADGGMVNIGGIRADIEKGDVTIEDIYNVMPFDNKVVVVEIDGKKIIDWLKKGKVIVDPDFKPESNRTYRIGTMDFLAASFRIAPEKTQVYDIMVRDLLITELKRKGTLP